MLQLIEYLFCSAIVIVFNQLYAYSVSLKGLEKQYACQRLGVTYLTLGVLSFVIRTPSVIIAGFILIMMGLRLIAHGLDRINKTTFIDRYDWKN